MTRAHIFFTGIVQGVGFRYTTLSMAKPLGLTGWVRNLSDGRVEAIVEGKEKDIEKLCRGLKQYFDGSVSDCDISYQEFRTEFKDFTIRS